MNHYVCRLSMNDNHTVYRMQLTGYVFRRFTSNYAFVARSWLVLASRPVTVLFNSECLHANRIYDFLEKG